MLFENAGFKNIRVESLGGVFWVLGKTLQEAGETVLRRLFRGKGPFYDLLLILFRVALIPLSAIIYCLDYLDNEKRWTLNYGCVGFKPAESELKRK